MDKKVYVAPKVETFEIEAEQGFSATTASVRSFLNDWSDSDDDFDDVSF